MTKKNALTTAIDKALENRQTDLAARLKAERTMCTALVRALLARGYAVSIHDGEAMALKGSTKQADIMAALFTTDQDTIYARHPHTDSTCNWTLIYGNDGYDVVSDFIDNELGQSIWNEVLRPTSDRIENQMLG